jgi:hypothetical protein
MLGDGDAIDVFQLIAERKIVEAIRRGEFDGLPGDGEPLHISDDPLVPPERRLANRILKNAGMVPVEVSLRKELDQLRHQHAQTRSAQERDSLMREIRMMILRIGVAHRESSLVNRRQ